MNIGMLDAHNLAWKLALVASGRSPDWLLETYAEERAPVAAEVLAWTHALVRFGTIRNPLKRAVRDTLTPIISRIAPVHDRFVRRLSQQHVAYRTSRLTRHDEGSAPGPGDRAPDVEVMVHGGRTQRLYEVLRGARHVMLVSSTGDLDEVASTELGQFRDMLDVAVGGFDSRAKSRYLIRPDGYIAARDHADQMPSILDYLRCLFGDLEIRHRSASRTGGAAGEVATGSSTGTGYGMMNRFRFVIAE